MLHKRRDRPGNGHSKEIVSTHLNLLLSQSDAFNDPSTRSLVRFGITQELFFEDILVFRTVYFVSDNPTTIAGHEACCSWLQTVDNASDTAYDHQQPRRCDVPGPSSSLTSKRFVVNTRWQVVRNSVLRVDQESEARICGLGDRRPVRCAGGIGCKARSLRKVHLVRIVVKGEVNHSSIVSSSNCKVGRW